VIRFYSASPEYTYWTLGLTAVLTAKDVKETIARKLELDAEIFTLLLSIEGQKEKKLTDDVSIVEMSNDLDVKKTVYKFVIDIPPASGKEKYFISSNS
jgi:hypothetical protein